MGKFLCQDVDRFHMGHEKNSNLNATTTNSLTRAVNYLAKKTGSFVTKIQFRRRVSFCAFFGYCLAVVKSNTYGGPLEPKAIVDQS